MTTDVVITIVALDGRNVNKLDPDGSFAPTVPGWNKAWRKDNPSANKGANSPRRLLSNLLSLHRVEIIHEVLEFGLRQGYRQVKPCPTYLCWGMDSCIVIPKTSMSLQHSKAIRINPLPTAVVVKVLHYLASRREAFARAANRSIPELTRLTRSFHLHRLM